jgi:predicted nucleotidyltransferase component of viral defense system
MDNVVSLMLEKYACQNLDDYSNALKEIIQEIALLGLWRAKFFEKAAFYGGTSLRILYGLNRFSENLDFSLLSPDLNFDLSLYNHAVQKELNAFGFELEVVSKPKKQTQVISAFIKTETKIQLLNLKIPPLYSKHLPRGQQLKIKMEIDTDPPPLFLTEIKTLLQPFLFSVKSYCLEDAFAGKIHALLCRNWQLRIKGRDWYDFVWFIGRNIPVRIKHLEQRLIQSEHWDIHEGFTENKLKAKLREKIKILDIEKAKSDVSPFIKDHASIEIWSHDFFLELVEKLKTV